MKIKLIDKDIIKYTSDERMMCREDILFIEDTDFEVSFTKFKLLYELYEAKNNNIDIEEELINNNGLYKKAIRHLIEDRYIEVLS